MKDYKYLLYIDILGFSDLVKTDYSKVEKLFRYIDNLNVHQHGAFHTIVFSDTILIFNKQPALKDADHEYLVMYACEFVQDLLIRSIDLEIQFRAILNYEQFHHEKLENIEAYYGNALLKSYYKEKTINGQGLFIDKSLLKYNKIFKSIEFDAELNFVFLTQTLDRLKFYEITEASLPLDPIFVWGADEFIWLKREVKILEILKKNIDNQQDSKIRSKYLQTYHLYRQQYGDIVGLFEKNNFNHRVISPKADWDDIDK